MSTGEAVSSDTGGRAPRIPAGMPPGRRRAAPAGHPVAGPVRVGRPPLRRGRSDQ